MLSERAIAVISIWQNADVHQYRFKPAGKNTTIGIEKNGKKRIYRVYFAKGIVVLVLIFGLRDIP